VAEAFRLRRLLELRKRAQEAAEQARAAALRAEAGARACLDSLLAEEEEVREGIRASASDPATLRLLDGAREATAARCAAARARLAAFSRDSEERGRELSEAMKQVKVLERLREKRIRTAAREAERQDRNLLDEVAAWKREEES
jgi:flagellar export protein FliJ